MFDRLEAAPIWLHAVLLAGLVARLAVLAVDDRIADRPRAWAAGRSRFAGELLICHWCTAVWVAAAATVLWVAWPGPTLVFAVAGTVAWAGAWLAERS